MSCHGAYYTGCAELLTAKEDDIFVYAMNKYLGFDSSAAAGQYRMFGNGTEIGNLLTTVKTSSTTDAYVHYTRSVIDISGGSIHFDRDHLCKWIASVMNLNGHQYGVEDVRDTCEHNMGRIRNSLWETTLVRDQMSG